MYESDMMKLNLSLTLGHVFHIFRLDITAGVALDDGSLDGGELLDLFDELRARFLGFLVDSGWFSTDPPAWFGLTF